MEEEMFKKIDGYDIYSVSNLGNVRNDETNHILKGGKNSRGYLHVSLYKNGKKSHRIIHQLVARAFIPNPENKPCVDHINGDKTNNCVDNLRYASNSENAMNQKKSKNNTSGVKGVSWHTRDNKWRAHIKIDGKNMHLGLFEDIEEAKKARIAAVDKMFREFAHSSERRTENI